jgi:hypothetical protein
MKRKLKLLIFGHTEYLVPIVAIIVWLLFAAGGKWFGWSTYPIGYFQKLAFGIVGISVLMGVAWITMGSWFPKLKKLIDPDTNQLEMLGLWEQVKLAFWFFALYVGGAVFLASLY